MNVPLSETDARALREALDAMSQRAKKPLSLEGLLQSWREFVTSVAAGYRDSIYDYTNDLSVRDLLEELHAALPSGLQQSILGELAHVDERFNSATRLVAQPMAPGTPLDAKWWWLRVPKVLKGELEADLKAGGVI